MVTGTLDSDFASGLHTWHREAPLDLMVDYLLIGISFEACVSGWVGSYPDYFVSLALLLCWRSKG